MDYCARNGIIVENQSGFRESHSCEPAIVAVCDDFVRSIDCDNFILAVFLDFKRAFETVDREILIQKLEMLGITHNVLNWFKSYLCNRSQRVIYGNCGSAPVNVRFGVPQGTVLGPLLFLLYINDLVGSTNKCKTVLFADDTMLYKTGKDLRQMENDMKDELSNLFKWLCENKLSLNTTKSKFCLFAKKSRINAINFENINISVNGENISHSNEIKYLGVILDSSLSFHSHVDYGMRKFSKKVGFLSRVGTSLSMSTKLSLYNAIVLPHLQFCSTLLVNLPQYKLDQLEKTQKRALRIILKCNRCAPVKSMLNVLNILSLRQRLEFNMHLFVFKLKHNLLPEYICDRLKLFVQDQPIMY